MIITRKTEGFNLKVILLGVVLAVVIATGFSLIKPQKAQALMGLNPDPVAGVDIPLDQKWILNFCDERRPIQSPGFVRWISEFGRPADQEITVPQGTSAIALEYHFAGAVCAGNSAVLQTSNRITGASPGVIGAVGNTMTLNYTGAGGPGNFNSVGTYRKTGFGFFYAPPGGFQNSGVYTVVLDTQGINQFTTGAFLCIGNGFNAGGLYNFSNNCTTTSPGLSIVVNVTPQGPDQGSCNVRAPGGTVVEPNQTVSLQFTMSNDGPRDWDVNQPNSTRYRLQNQTPWPGVIGDVNAPTPGQNIELTGFGWILRKNLSTAWTQDIVIPPDILPPTSFSATRTLTFIIYGNNDQQGLHTVGAPCSVTLSVQRPVERPYFRSYGADVLTGRSFANGSTCSPADTNSTIKAFVRQDGSGWKGSGSEFAARATGVIENFLSASTRTSAPTSPNALSFGNRSASSNSFSPAPGSDKTAYTGCIPDYWNEYIEGKFPTTGARDARNLALEDNDSGNQASSTGEWAGAAIGVSNSGYYFYNGDLTITDNVTLAGYSFNADDTSADLSQIPKFVLVVRGNINIAPNVTQLQGVFIAQEDPVNPGKGVINTCARLSTNWQQCEGSKLEVQGSFIAREVKLNRLRGDVDDAGVREGSNAPQAAEVFIFRPDLLFSTAGDQQNPTTRITDYDSIVGLPPVL